MRLRKKKTFNKKFLLVTQSWLTCLWKRKHHGVRSSVSRSLDEPRPERSLSDEFVKVALEQLQADSLARTAMLLCVNLKEQPQAIASANDLEKLVQQTEALAEKTGAGSGAEAWLVSALVWICRPVCGDSETTPTYSLCC